MVATLTRKREKLTTLKWKKATAGFGGVVINKNAGGDEMHVEGLADGKNGRLLGLGTHANSVIAFDLPEGVVSLEAKVGLDAGGTKQGKNNKVRAMVFTSEPGSLVAGGNTKAGSGTKPYGLEAARDAMITQRTLFRRLRFRIQEAAAVGARLDAKSATDAVIRVHEHYAIRAVKRRANRANLRAGRVLAKVAELRYKKRF